MRVVVLGCGGSGGVPLVGPAGGYWGACDRHNPRNRRRRVSILVEDRGQSILIDTAPDLREQLLDAGAARIDAVLYTHDHADHVNGIDELRHIRTKGRGAIDCYGDEATMAAIERRFLYAFRQNEDGSGVLYKPFLRRRDLGGPFGPVTVGPLAIRPFIQDHGFGTMTIGYRIGDMAYSTDLVDLPEESWTVLTGLRLWIVDCLRDEPHPTHAHFDKVMGWVERLKPGRAVLTHMNHSMDYETVRRRCPPGVEPAFDGMILEIEDP